MCPHPYNAVIHTKWCGKPTPGLPDSELLQLGGNYPMSEDIDITNDDMKAMGPSDDDKLWALLAYVFSPLVPIIIFLLEDKKNRPFLKTHNAQALAWGLLSLVVGAVTSFLCGIPGLLMWFAAIYWGWQAYQGQQVTIPVITDLVKGQGWA